MRIRALRKALLDGVDYRFLIAGSAHWAIVLLLYSTTAVAPGIGDWFFLRGDFPYLSSLLGTLVVLLGALIISGKDTALLKTKLLPTASFLLITSATALFFGIGKGLLSEEFFILSGVVAGAGTGLVLLFFVEVFAQVKPQRIFFYVAAQNLFGYLIYMLVTIVASAWADTVVVFLAALQSLFFYQSGSNPKSGYQDRKPWLREDVSPIAFSLLALFVGFCYGVIRCLTVSLRSGSLTLTFGDSLGILFGVALLTSSGLIFLRKNPSEYIYQIAFPIIAVGFVAVPLFLSGVYIALPFFQSALAYSYGLLWFFIRLSCQHNDNNPLKTAAAVFLCLQGGQLIGALVIPPVAVINNGILYLAIVMLFVTSLTLIFFFSYQQHRESKNAERVKELNFETQCSSIAEKYEFTPREAEIFRFLARGLSSKEIEKRLTLSYNTVKSHTSHIYTKLDIHSRDDLNVVLENAMDQLKQG